MARQYRSLIQSTAPSAEPVDADDVKTHTHISHDAEDTLLESMIAASRHHVEEITGMQLINASWTMRLDSFPDSGNELVLPRGPVSSITSVSYNDTAGDEQTLTEDTDFILDENVRPPTLYLVPESWDWPSTYGEPNDVTVVWVAGYGTAGSSVPDRYKHCIRLMSASLFMNRELWEAAQSNEWGAFDALIGSSILQHAF
jgi:uncharacterized phiE125 gp8 family phage protein